jgi:Integrase core domain
MVLSPARVRGAGEPPHDDDAARTLDQRVRVQGRARRPSRPAPRRLPVAEEFERAQGWSYRVYERRKSKIVIVILFDGGNIQTLRMNAITERWIGGCRRELLDRTLIWNQAHLRWILRQYETHHNQHRPHRALLGAAPLKPLPDLVALDWYRVRKHAHVGGLINEYRLVA